jgi:hypothetical protein
MYRQATDFYSWFCILLLCWNSLKTQGSSGRSFRIFFSMRPLLQFQPAAWIQISYIFARCQFLHFGAIWAFLFLFWQQHRWGGSIPSLTGSLMFIVRAVCFSYNSKVKYFWISPWLLTIYCCTAVPFHNNPPFSVATHLLFCFNLLEMQESVSNLPSSIQKCF